MYVNTLHVKLCSLQGGFSSPASALTGKKGQMIRAFENYALDGIIKQQDMGKKKST